MSSNAQRRAILTLWQPSNSRMVTNFMEAAAYTNCSVRDAALSVCSGVGDPDCLSPQMVCPPRWFVPKIHCWEDNDLFGTKTRRLLVRTDLNSLPWSSVGGWWICLVVWIWWLIGALVVLSLQLLTSRCHDLWQDNTSFFSWCDFLESHRQLATSLPRILAVVGCCQAQV